MPDFKSSLLGIQCVPILIAATQALLFPQSATAAGQVLDAAPSKAVHVQGLSSLTLGLTQLILAFKAPAETQRLVLWAMVPTKALAAFLMYTDGHPGVAIWEAVSGLMYCFA